MKLKTALLICVCIAWLFGFGSAEEMAATVNQRPIYESDVQDRLQSSNIINNYASADMTQEQKDEIARLAHEAVLQMLIEEEALIDEAENRGLSAENETIKADADERYERMIGSTEDYVLASYPNLQGEELDAQVDELLRMTGATRETYRSLAMRSAILAALDHALTQELTTPDENAIQAYYDQLYAEQKEQFDSDHNSFEAALLQKKIVVYRPKDLKLIQKAEFLFDTDLLAFLRQTAAINADLADEMREEQHAEMLPEVEKAVQAVLDGTQTFEQLMEELKPGSSSSVNYFHPDSTRFGEEYYSRANAFKNSGEVSSIYEMVTGFAVLYYAGDLPACEKVPLDEVRDAIAQLLTSESSAASLTAAKEAIVAAADVRFYESEAK